MRCVVVLALAVAVVTAADNKGYRSNEKLLRGNKDQYYQRLQLAAPKYNPGRYDAGRYDPGHYDPGRYDPGRYDPSKYNTGKYEPGKYDDQGKYNPDNSGAYNGDRGDRGGAYDGGYGDRGNKGGSGGFYNTVEVKPTTTEAPITTPAPKLSQYFDYRYAIDSDEYDSLYKKIILVNDEDNSIVGKGFFDYVLPNNYRFRTDYIADARLYY